jgi:hypothetical protein
MNCPKCNNALAENAKFCPECGAKIEAVPPPDKEVFCAQCGQKMLASAKFCPSCGVAKGQVAAYAEAEAEAIAPQNFSLAIGCALAAIALSLASLFVDTESDNAKLIGWVCAIFDIGTLVCLRKYLENFHDSSVLRLSGWFIVVTVVLNVVNLMPLPQSTLGVVKIWVALGAWVVVSLLLGICLQLMSNDFVGGIKNLGTVICAATIIDCIILAIYFFSGNTDNSVLDTLSVFVTCAPTAMMAVLFYRAKEFVSRTHENFRPEKAEKSWEAMILAGIVTFIIIVVKIVQYASR